MGQIAGILADQACNLPCQGGMLGQARIFADHPGIFAGGHLDMFAGGHSGMAANGYHGQRIRRQ